MTLHWGALPFTTLASGLAVTFFFIRRAEAQSGRALLGWSFLSWNPEKCPGFFRFRLARFALAAVSCGLAALAGLLKFLGIF